VQFLILQSFYPYGERFFVQENPGLL